MIIIDYGNVMAVSPGQRRICETIALTIDVPGTRAREEGKIVDYCRQEERPEAHQAAARYIR